MTPVVGSVGTMPGADHARRSGACWQLLRISSAKVACFFRHWCRLALLLIPLRIDPDVHWPLFIVRFGRVYSDFCRQPGLLSLYSRFGLGGSSAA